MFARMLLFTLPLITAPLLFVTAPLAARTAAESRFVISVGANQGVGSDEPLRYAEADAQRFHDLMLDLGNVRPDHAFLVVGKTHAELLTVFATVQRQVTEQKRLGQSPTLIFYFAGHGDREALHLPGEALKLAALRRTLASIPAGLRLTILDACRIGGQLRSVKRGPSFQLLLGPGGPKGTVELQASSEGEAAQESEELNGAIFTHFLLSGLRGAADFDRDGRVTLAEIYAYSYRRTLLRSASALVVQHPELVLQISNAGEVVVTEPRLSSAFLELPTGAERYLIFSMPGAFVVGEVSGSGASRLAVPPGQLLVVSRAGQLARLAEVDLSWGGTRRLASEDFKEVASEELAVRSRGELPSWRLSGAFGPEVALEPSAQQQAYTGFVRLAYQRGWEFAGSVGVGGVGTLETTATSETGSWSRQGNAWAALATMTVGRPWRFGRGTLTPSVGLEGRVGFQSREAGQAKPADQTVYTAGGVRSEVRLGWALGQDVSVLVGSSLSALWQGGDEPFLPLFSVHGGLAYAL